MHIPDGYLSPATSAVGFAAMAPVWAVAGRKVRARFQAAAVPRLGLFAAFSFVVMMFNMPLPGGTSGHAVGGALMALALGPWEAAMGLSAALVLQALFFADGGIWALGVNCFNLAAVLPFTAYFVFRALRRGGLSEVPAAVLAGWFGMMASALCVSVELGIQPILFHTASGAPLYFPYGLKVALGAMMLPHALVAAPVEGALTGLAWSYLRRAQPMLLADRAGKAGRYCLWPVWAGLFLLALLTPIGLLTNAPAWGEWGRRAPAWFSGYAIPGLGERAGYILSAVLGIAALGAMAWGLNAFARGGAKAEALAEDHAETR